MGKDKSSGQKSSSANAAKKAGANGKANQKTARAPKQVPNAKPPNGMSQARYDRLVAEAQAPYKGLRKFVYISCGASGAIGGFVFLTKILAGRDVAQSLPNLALQVGVVALMIFLFRWEDRKQED
jgi:hypothetical protein